jgi:hypothetical protein
VTGAFTKKGVVTVAVGVIIAVGREEKEHTVVAEQHPAQPLSICAHYIKAPT